MECQTCNPFFSHSAAIHEGWHSYLEVEKWKFHRKLINPTFTHKILCSFVPVFAEKAEMVLKSFETIKEQQKVDISKILSNYTIPSLFGTMFGLDEQNPLYNINMSELNKSFTIILQGVIRRMFNPFYHIDFIYYRSPLFFYINKYITRTKEIINIIIKEKRKEYQSLLSTYNSYNNNNDKQKRFLDLLIEVAEDNDKFTNDDLRNELFTFILAGSETSSTANCFVLTMLAMHPEIQEEVYKEILEVVGPTRTIEHTDLPKLKLLERVIKETLRLFPAVPFAVRQICEDLKLSTGEVLPQGSSVMLSMINMQRCEHYYPDPLKFDLDRFLPEVCAKRTPYSYAPFLLGPRNCVGWKYAMLSMTTICAYIIRNYKMTTEYKKVEDIRLKIQIVIEPVGGYKLSLTKRS